MNPRLGRVVWWARQGLLTGGAVLGVLCILVTIGAAAFGLRPLVFQSGSMSPTIDTGALAIAHDVDASSLHAGQIVSVPTGTGERVTHRIVHVVRDGDTARLELRGDANQASDAHTYRVTHADRVLFSVPLAGYAVGWLTGPIGLFLLGLYVAFLLSVLVKGSPQDAASPQDGTRPGSTPPQVESPGPAAQAIEPRELSLAAPTTRPARGLPQNAGTAVLGLVMLGALATEVVLPVRVTPTLAAFTDPVAVAGTSITARLPAPANVTCAKGNGQRVVFTWDPVALAGYTYHFGTAGSSTASPAAGTTTYTSANKEVGTFWVVATRSFSGVVWTSADSVHYDYDNGVCTLLP